MKAKTLEKILNILNFHNLMHKRMKSISRAKGDFVPKSVSSKYDTSIQTINDKKVVTLGSNLERTKLHLIFFHGGAYVFEISKQHWDFIIDLTKKLNIKATVIDYPLAPESSYKDTFDMVTKAYEYLCDAYPEDDFIFMGDSAGGGLALALCEKLVSMGINKLPSKLILLSPFLDASLSYINKNDTNDCILDFDFLKYCSDLYSRGDDKKQYLLSPIFGNLNGLPDIGVFYGTHELFINDFLKLKELSKTVDANFNFFEYKDMPHDWIVLPIPERDILKNDIKKFINNDK